MSVRGEDIQYVHHTPVVEPFPTNQSGTPIPPAAVEVQGAIHCILCHHQVFVVAAVVAAGAKKERQHALACQGEEDGRAGRVRAVKPDPLRGML